MELKADLKRIGGEEKKNFMTFITNELKEICKESAVGRKRNWFLKLTNLTNEQRDEIMTLKLKNPEREPVFNDDSNNKETLYVLTRVPFAEREMFTLTGDDTLSDWDELLPSVNSLEGLETLEV